MLESLSREERGDVGRYFDEEADSYIERYRKNPILNRMRRRFRKVTERYPFSFLLDLGCGPGMDLLYFGKKYPDRFLCGVDLSPKMVQIARENLKKEGLSHIPVVLGSVETLSSLFPSGSFDMIIVYFGALNTMKDLSPVVKELKEVSVKGGYLVCTFINRFYIQEAVYSLIRGRGRRGFSRWVRPWRGYSLARYLPTYPRSPREIELSFTPYFKVVYREGFSILFPPWYRPWLYRLYGPFRELLWLGDLVLSQTPLFGFGEYLLYVFQNCSS